MKKIKMWGLRVVFVSLDACVNRMCSGTPTAADDDAEPPSTQRAPWTRELTVEAPSLAPGEYCVFELDVVGRLLGLRVTRLLPELGIDVRTGTTTVAISPGTRGFRVYGTDEKSVAGECEIFEFRPWRLVVLTRQDARTRGQRSRMDAAV